ncbi:MAG: bifunctional demethylmenaquinone methyltransferase/2-methoxy-6-polyprenyl-1,4-benzoquinol methylase UbiE [Muribaculaceae bacterium]|nr:bifunctional demethylmenaquinone methyltransferase/2-methoxy-6-polyprenyl-1,4-benzoquinol methylase UbiE [Muribaculaceae bacterium]
MSPDCENIKPYKGDNSAKKVQVEKMFDNIAPAYDLMNRAMTLGIDKLWRRKAVKMIHSHGATKILDVATGTGDLAMLLAQRLDPISVIGIDLSARMIEIGRRKVAAAGLGDVVKLTVGDCLDLAYPDETFDCVTVAYGVRNFEDLARGYSEMFRVLQPGGMMCVIELSTPTMPVIRPLYNIYSTKIIPAVGRVVSRDTDAYTYLPRSIAAVPQGEKMLEMLTGAGFVNARFKTLTLGVCTIYTAFKPQQQ